MEKHISSPAKRSAPLHISGNKFANILSPDKMQSTVDSFDLKGVEWTDVRSATLKQRKNAEGDVFL